MQMALLNQRSYLGCDISEEYISIARERLRMHSDHYSMKTQASAPNNRQTSILETL